MWGGGGEGEGEGDCEGREVKPTQYMYHSQDGKDAVGLLLMETVSMVAQGDSSQFEQMMNSQRHR